MNVDVLAGDLAEFEAALAAAKGDRLRRLLEANVSKIRSELAALQAPAAPKSEAARTAAVPTSQDHAPTGARAESTKQTDLALPLGVQFNEVKGYSWTETSKAVKLYINTEGCGLMTPADVVFQYSKSKRALLFYTVGAARRRVSLSIRNLKGDLDPKCVDELFVGSSSSAVRFKENEVIFQLNKAKTGMWYDLVNKDTDSSIGGTKKDGDDENPGDALMKMMKKMYDEGDDKMRETIGKAMLESKQKQMAGAEL
jgi:hypothetical protein